MELLSTDVQGFDALGKVRGTVVALHGFGGSSQQSWVRTGWVKKLTQAGYNVRAIALPGHGNLSEEKPGTADSSTEPCKVLPGFLLQLKSFLEHLPAPVVGLGFSYGARLIWELAGEDNSHLMLLF